jgi:invasion protein IalB
MKPTGMDKASPVCLRRAAILVSILLLSAKLYGTPVSNSFLTRDAIESTTTNWALCTITSSSKVCNLHQKQLKKLLKNMTSSKIFPNNQNNQLG